MPKLRVGMPPENACPRKARGVGICDVEHGTGLEMLYEWKKEEWDMAGLVKGDIVKGLNKLGLVKGDHVLVHSALGSFGHVSGGAATVIAGLLEAVGPEGTIVMPSFSPSREPFDVTKSETNLGVIAQAFWKRKDALRSRHPVASVAAVGAKAQWLVEGHEEVTVAHGKGTPYVRLTEIGGKILLLGADQDRSTFLHAAESLAKLPYLRTLKTPYIAADGKLAQSVSRYFPGPHRDFIGLQGMLEQCGLMKKGRIGKCVAQLSDAAGLLEAMLELLKEDPGLFISDNPSLPDGIWQHADILRAKWAKESFTLAADSGWAGQHIEEVVDNLHRFGIDNVVLSYVNDVGWENIDASKRKWYLQGLRLERIKVAAIKVLKLQADQAIDLLRQAQTKTLIVPATCRPAEIRKVMRSGFWVQIENVQIGGDDFLELIKSFPPGKAEPTIAFNPLEFARMGEHPFLKTYRIGGLKTRIGSLYINDGLASGQRRPLEEGLAEIKEIISLSRARSFDGLFILQSDRVESFRESVGDFMTMLKELGS